MNYDELCSDISVIL